MQGTNDLGEMAWHHYDPLPHLQYFPLQAHLEGIRKMFKASKFLKMLFFFSIKLKEAKRRRIVDYNRAPRHVDWWNLPSIASGEMDLSDDF